MSAPQMTTAEALRSAIAETLSIDAQGLQAAIGQLVVATSAECPDAGPDAHSLCDPQTRTTVLLADRIPAGQEAAAVAREIERHHGRQAAQAVLGARASELLGDDGKVSKYIESSSMTNDLGSSAHRYALASHDPDGVVRWSVGGEWSASLLDHSPTLMTGPEVDAFKVRHPDARIVDVIVYREACEVYSAGCNSVLDHSERSTPQTRQAAREAGIKALIRAGFPEDALNIVGPEHTEQAPAAMKMYKFASGDWTHLFGVGSKETRCRIVIDLEQSKLIAAQEWTGLKFEGVRGDRLKDLAESVIEVNEAHTNLDDWNSELTNEMPEWVAQRKVLNYIEQPLQQGVALVNRRLLDALRLVERPLVRLGDFVGNVDKGGASGQGEFDRCAIVLEVRRAIAEAENLGEQPAYVRAIPDADLLAEINRRGMLQPLYGAIGAMHDHLDRTGALDGHLTQYLTYRLRREEAAITGMPDSSARVANWQECIDQLDGEARAVKVEDSPSPGM